MANLPPSITTEEERYLFPALLQFLPYAAFVSDYDSAKIIEVNAATLRLFRCDRDDLIGRTGRSLSDPEDYAFVDRFSATLVEEGEAWHPSYPFRNHVGRRFYGDTQVRVVVLPTRRVLLTFVRDITEQLDLAGRVARVERLAALGSLASSIAHEINNPATVITNNAELVRRRLKMNPHKTDDVLEDLNREMSDAIGRIVGLTRDVSDHARVDDRVMLVSMDDIAQSAARIAGGCYERRRGSSFRWHRRDRSTDAATRWSRPWSTSFGTPARRSRKADRRRTRSASKRAKMATRPRSR